MNTIAENANIFGARTVNKNVYAHNIYVFQEYKLPVG